MRWVVVGGGAAGCVVAGRLSQRRGDDVTLVEAGPADLPAPARSPSFHDALAAPGWTWPGPLLRGRGLGGSGAVNAGLMTSGDPEQYRRWGWADVAATSARVLVPAETAAAHELGPLDRALLAAAPDAALAPLARRGGRRVTSADAYLGLAPERLTVLADTTATHVELAGRRAVGVGLADGSSLHADRVVVCAGALATPALLARSGVVVDGLGDGLRNHPGLPMVLRLRPDVGVEASSLTTATMLRRGDVQVVALNHLGPGAPGAAMLLASLMVSSSTGRVGVDDGGQPVAAWELDTADRSALAGAAGLVEELVAAAPFAELVEDATFAEAPAGVHHWTSTCALGRVLDADGAVRGHDGVCVADASAFPDLPTTNTYLPTLIAAEHLVARWR